MNAHTDNCASVPKDVHTHLVFTHRTQLCVSYSCVSLHKHFEETFVGGSWCRVGGFIYHHGECTEEFISWDYVAEAQHIMADQEVENRTGNRALERPPPDDQLLPAPLYPLKAPEPPKTAPPWFME